MSDIQSACRLYYQGTSCAGCPQEDRIKYASVYLVSAMGVPTTQLTCPQNCSSWCPEESSSLDLRQDTEDSEQRQYAARQGFANVLPRERSFFDDDNRTTEPSETQRKCRSSRTAADDANINQAQAKYFGMADRSRT